MGEPILNFDSAAVGRVIRRLRLKQGKTQTVLSGLAAIDRQHWYAIECGRRPRLDTFARIAYALGKRPSDLLALIEQEQEATP